MHRYRVLEQSRTYSTLNTYRYTHIHIHTLRLIPKMGTKVRNRNLRLNRSKTFPIPTKFYQSSSFYIPYRMPIKKTPNESRTKNAFRGTVPPRGLRRGLGRAASRADEQTRTLARLKPIIRDFHPNTPKPTIFHQNQLYITSLHLQLHLITSIYTNSTRLISISSSNTQITI